jgi:DNA (cytosine-5)-methyltransferase 1
MLRLLDIFAGIGGMSLGLQRSGHFRPVAFCEINPFCHHVLRKHWPEVPIYGDVRALTRDRLHADGIAVDAICGGFPCQDISAAGRGAGLHGARSVLWREFARLLGDLRPRYAIVENTDALTFRGLGTVLGDLADLGFDAVWHSIPASALGARHLRRRVWIVAHTDRSGLEEQFYRHAPELATALGTHAWGFEPELDRVAPWLPYRVDRVQALGNSAVPQIPELIGRLIGNLEATL